MAFLLISGFTSGLPDYALPPAAPPLFLAGYIACLLTTSAAGAASSAEPAGSRGGPGTFGSSGSSVALNGDPKKSGGGVAAEGSKDPESPVGQPPGKPVADLNYMISKIAEVRALMEAAEVNPGKYSRREVRNWSRQLSMLERRYAEAAA
eukprot:RCo003469